MDAITKFFSWLVEFLKALFSAVGEDTSIFDKFPTTAPEEEGTTEETI